MALLVLLCATVLSPSAIATPKAILVLSSIRTLHEAADARYPNLSEFVVRNGVAVMTVGPKSADPVATLTAGRYAGTGSDADADWLQESLESVRGTAAVQPLGAGWVVYDRAAGDAAGPRPFRRALADALKRHAVVLVSRSPRPGPASSTSPDLEIEDRLLGDVLSVAPGVPVMVVSPFGRRHRLAPGQMPSWLAMSGGKALLTSDTTRAPGIVSNLDVAPTLATIALGRTPAGSGGHVIRRERGALAVVRTARLQRALHVLALAGTPACAVLGILTFTAALSLLAVSPRRRWPRILLLAAVMAPTGLAISAGTQPQSVPGFAGIAGGLTLALTVAVWALGGLFAKGEETPDASVLYTALLLSVLFLAADTLGHGMAVRLSPLTSLFQTGVRFYGLGNEYAAVFVPALLFVVALTMERAEIGVPSAGALAATGIALAAGGAFLGWRSAGANFGGMLTALAAGSVFWTKAARKAGLRFAWAVAVIGSVAIVSAIVCLDASGAQPTHIGAVARQGATGGGATLGGIVSGKAAIALRLALSPAFLVSVAGGLGLWRLTGLRRAVKDAAAAHGWCGVAFAATVWGALAALVVNDTGPVMLAVMLAGAVLPMLFLAHADRGLAARVARDFAEQPEAS